jgi:hypothetical protein
MQMQIDWPSIAISYQTLKTNTLMLKITKTKWSTESHLESNPCIRWYNIEIQIDSHLLFRRRMTHVSIILFDQISQTITPFAFVLLDQIMNDHWYRKKYKVQTTN